jgi:hypothetical protein
VNTKQFIAGVLIAGAGIGAFTGVTATATASGTPTMQAATGTQFTELPDWRRYRGALPSDIELPEGRNRKAFMPGLDLADLPELPPITTETPQASALFGVLLPQRRSSAA